MKKEKNFMPMFGVVYDSGCWDNPNKTLSFYLIKNIYQFELGIGKNQDDSSRWGFVFSEDGVSLKFGRSDNEPRSFFFLNPYTNTYIKSEKIIYSCELALRDFDGTLVGATVSVKFCVFNRGGKDSFLNHILPTVDIYRIEVEYNQETGKRKNSWKGGTYSVTAPLNLSAKIQPSIGEIQTAISDFMEREGFQIITLKDTHF